MNHDNYEFPRFGKKCNCGPELDDYAIATHICHNKHSFFFRHPKSADYVATAMSNIPQEKWKDFIAANRLNEVEVKYQAAMKSH
ncbi:MAG: hypothetical protein OQK98_16540 [Gammaproteobacteria bacterium]|nr:hypothetical protein [Gammaproteobacteria bacterium]